MDVGLMTAIAFAGGCAAAAVPETATTSSAVGQPPKDLNRCGWPLYEAYAEAFIEAGRVVDVTTAARSTSEGQAYGLFFALVANDEARFSRIAAWTRDNLLGGRWDSGLPAWLWGADPQGRWRVLDANSATDADLWMAYAFLEAARLWGRPELLQRARQILENVLRANLRQMPGLGPMLLPGPVGFVLKEGRRWRLNPSYLVPVQLERFAAAEMDGPWPEILDSAERVLVEGSRDGHAPDWVSYDVESGFMPDTEAPPVSSYDAIRVGLWAAFGASDAVRAAVSGRLQSFLSTGVVVERVPLAPAATPVASPRAPPGFLAVVLAMAVEAGEQKAAEELRARLDRVQRDDGLYGSPPTYYDQNLALFGLGFAEGRFDFGPRGELEVAWRSSNCSE